MKKISIYLMVLMALFTACEEDPEPKETGDLSVSVVVSGYYDSYVVEGAQVYTSPATIQGTTDAFGSVLLSDIEVGSYEVYATYSNYGSGKVAINIQSGELTKATIAIIEGVNVGIAPTIEVILPAQPASFALGEEINFSADVNDEDTPIQSLKVTWESDLDGVLNTDSPSNSGNIAFSTSTLSRGSHTITLTVEDDDEYQAITSFTVNTLSPSEITMNAPVKNDGQIELSWEKHDGESFEKYDVYRTLGDGTTQDQELIATITDVDSTTFTDTQAPITYQVGYYICITNEEGYSRNSNEEIVEFPSGAVFNFEASDMLKHPTQTVVYLVDAGSNKVIKYNYKTEEITTEASFEGSAGRCTIGDNGQGVEIYVASSNGYVYVFDADDLSLNIQISTDKDNSSVAIDGQGTVIVGLDPSPDAWWTDPLRTFNRSTGMLIDGGGDFDGDIIKQIPGTSEFIAISTGVSPVDMDYYKLAADGTFEIHSDDSYHGDYSLSSSIFRISDDGTYTITSSNGAVYLANSSMEYKGELQSGSLSYSDFAFSDDGSIIYAATSNRKSIQIGHYPALNRDDEILLRGYPVFVVRDDKELVILSKSSEYSNVTGIEIVQLED